MQEHMPKALQSFDNLVNLPEGVELALFGSHHVVAIGHQQLIRVLVASCLVENGIAPPIITLDSLACPTLPVVAEGILERTETQNDTVLPWAAYPVLCTACNTWVLRGSLSKDGIAAERHLCLHPLRHRVGGGGVLKGAIITDVGDGRS